MPIPKVLSDQRAITLLRWNLRYVARNATPPLSPVSYLMVSTTTVKGRVVSTSPRFMVGRVTTNGYESLGGDRLLYTTSDARCRNELFGEQCDLNPGFTHTISKGPYIVSSHSLQGWYIGLKIDVVNHSVTCDIPCMRSANFHRGDRNTISG